MSRVCVCASENFREGVTDKLGKQESQDGGLCVKTHTHKLLLNVSCSSSVVSQSNVSYCKETNNLTSNLTHVTRWHNV